MKFSYTQGGMTKCKTHYRILDNNTFEVNIGCEQYFL